MIDRHRVLCAFVAAVIGRAGSARADTPPAPADPDCREEGLCTISERKSAYHVVVRLGRKPPSRVWCYFDTDDSLHQAVEFDPAVSSRLTRSLTLRAGKKWHLTCDAAPRFVQVFQKGTSVSVDTAWTFNSPDGGGADVLDLTWAASSVTDNVAELRVHPRELQFDKPGGGAGKSGGESDVVALIPVSPDATFPVTAHAYAPITLSAAKRSLSAHGGGAVGGRSLDSTAPALVQDTLQILAEIALERGRTRAYAFLSERIADFVCTQLRVPAGSGLPIESDTTLLPATCDAIRNTTLPELAQSADRIAAAVEVDLAKLAIGVALDRSRRPRPEMATVWKAVRGLDVGGQPSPSAAAASLIETLGASLGDGDRARCRVSVAAGAAKACLEGSCETDDALMKQVKALAAKTDKKKCPDLQGEIPATSVVVQATQGILRAARSFSNATPWDLARSALALAEPLSDLAAKRFDAGIVANSVSPDTGRTAFFDAIPQSASNWIGQPELAKKMSCVAKAVAQMTCSGDCQDDTIAQTLKKGCADLTLDSKLIAAAKSLWTSAADLDAKNSIDKAAKADRATTAGRALADLVGILVKDDAGTPKSGLSRHLVPILTELQPILLDAIARHGSLTAHDAQLLLLALSEHEWVDPTEIAPTLPECSLDLAFAAMAMCHGQEGGCDTRTIADMLFHPEEHFDLGHCEDVLHGSVAAWPELPSLVSRGLDVVDPPSGAAPRDQERAALDIGFAVATELADRGAADEVKKVLEPTHRLAIAAVDRDTRTVLTEGLAVVRATLNDQDEKQKHLAAMIDRVAPVVTALVANAESLKKAADTPEQAEALRKARRETIEAVIDASTDRRARGGDRIGSLGANVGLYGFLVRDAPGETDTRKAVAGLGLPMGVALQWLPYDRNEDHPIDKNGERDCRFPLHLQVSFVDLGQFLTRKSSEPLQWNDFTLVGVQAGVILSGSPRDAIILGLDGRYIPGGARKGELQGGLFLTYYVPFFDFN